MYLCNMKARAAKSGKTANVCLLLALFLGLAGSTVAQPLATPDTTNTSNKRLYLLAGGSAVLYTGALVGLSEIWYKDVPRTSFHFFNDNRQWLQLDKAGHTLTAFHFSRAATDALRWAGADQKPAVWVGGLAGFVLLSPIEILDGRSADYGASWGDLAANAAGSALVIGQNLAWNELRVTPKFSFRTTKFAARRPNVLGKTLPEQIIKDYNGQTYWLAVNVKSFLPKESKWPAWLGVAGGYGGSGMVYNDRDFNRAQGFNLYRQYYLAPDLNLRAIKTNSKVLKAVFYVLDVVHLPLPALEYSGRKGMRFHPVYF